MVIVLKTPMEKILRFKTLKILLKLQWNCVTDNSLFRLHYQLSFIILWITLFVYAKIVDRFDIISCIFSPGSSIPAKTFDYACFTVSVYSVTFEQELFGLQSNMSTPQTNPGVVGFSDLYEQQIVRYHKYYFLTPFIVLIQIILFMMPRYLWRCIENGKMKMLVSGLQGPFLEEDKITERKKNIAEYFTASLGYNNYYGFMYVACELLNFVCVVFQMWFLNVVTGEAFSTYGIDAIKYAMMDEGKENDPFDLGFPVVGKCTFNTIGPGGNIQPNSGICSLPLNTVNRGYFAFFWFYLLTLGILNMFNLIYRLVTIAFPPVRLHLLQNVSITVPKKILGLIVKNSLYGDWFILIMMSKNLDGPIFDCIIEEIGMVMQGEKVTV